MLEQVRYYELIKHIAIQYNNELHDVLKQTNINIPVSGAPASCLTGSALQ